MPSLPVWTIWHDCAAMAASATFYDDLRSSYLKKRDLLADGLERIGFDVHRPQGTYFMMAGFDRFGFNDDRAFCLHLAETTRVVAIPPGVFYHRPEDGSRLVRFAFCKDEAILSEALDRMESKMVS